MMSSANVVFRDVDSSISLTNTIHKKLEKLNRFSKAIMSSRVVLDSPHKHKNKGKLFRASIELSVKGQAMTISNDDPSIHVAVRDAFFAAERKLKEQTSKKRDITRH